MDVHVEVGTVFAGFLTEVGEELLDLKLLAGDERRRSFDIQQLFEEGVQPLPFGIVCHRGDAIPTQAVHRGNWKRGFA